MRQRGRVRSNPSPIRSARACPSRTLQTLLPSVGRGPVPRDLQNAASRGTGPRATYYEAGACVRSNPFPVRRARACPSRTLQTRFLSVGRGPVPRERSDLSPIRSARACPSRSRSSSDGVLGLTDLRYVFSRGLSAAAVPVGALPYCIETRRSLLPGRH